MNSIHVRVKVEVRVKLRGQDGQHTVGGSCRSTTSGRGARNSMSHSIAMACSIGFSSSSTARGSRDIQRGLRAADYWG